MSNLAIVEATCVSALHHLCPGHDAKAFHKAKFKILEKSHEFNPKILLER